MPLLVSVVRAFCPLCEYQDDVTRVFYSHSKSSRCSLLALVSETLDARFHPASSSLFPVVLALADRERRTFFVVDYPCGVGYHSVPPCQQVLSSLIFAAVSLPWRSFIALIDYFPNLRNLEFTSLSFDDDNTNSTPLSRPLHGKLCFFLSEEKSLIAFSNWFAGLEVEYEELVIEAGYVSGTYSRCIVAACGRPSSA